MAGLDNSVTIVPACMWSDFLDVATDKDLAFCYTEEDSGVHVHGECIDELADILWAIQVVDSLASVFGSAGIPVGIHA